MTLAFELSNYLLRQLSHSWPIIVSLKKGIYLSAIYSNEHVTTGLCWALTTFDIWQQFPAFFQFHIRMSTSISFMLILPQFPLHLIICWWHFHCTMTVNFPNPCTRYATEIVSFRGYQTPGFELHLPISRWEPEISRF